MTAPEVLLFEGTDPVAGWSRTFEIVTSPTGEAVRFLAATNGSGSAWIERGEAETLIDFLRDWLARTAGA